MEEISLLTLEFMNTNVDYLEFLLNETKRTEQVARTKILHNYIMAMILFAGILLVLLFIPSVIWQAKVTILGVMGIITLVFLFNYYHGYKSEGNMLEKVIRDEKAKKITRDKVKKITMEFQNTMIQYTINTYHREVEYDYITEIIDIGKKYILTLSHDKRSPVKDLDMIIIPKRGMDEALLCQIEEILIQKAEEYQIPIDMKRG